MEMIRRRVTVRMRDRLDGPSSSPNRKIAARANLSIGCLNERSWLRTKDAISAAMECRDSIGYLTETISLKGQICA